MSKIFLLVLLTLIFIPAQIVYAHPGELDELGGRYINADEYNEYPVGSYHYYTGPYAGYTVGYKGEVPDKFKIDAAQKLKKITPPTLPSNPTPNTTPDSPLATQTNSPSPETVKTTPTAAALIFYDTLAKNSKKFGSGLVSLAGIGICIGMFLRIGRLQKNKYK
jgi:hypothetical protein